PEVAFSLLSLYFFFLLLRLFSKDKYFSLLSTFLLGLSYWHLIYGRSAFEVSLLLTLLLSGTYFFLKNHFSLAAVLFGLTFYTYNTANVFTPLLILFLTFYVFKINKNVSFSHFYKPILALTIFLLPIAFSVIFGHASDRFNRISIFNDPKIINTIIFKRTGFSSSNSFIESVFHNKVLSFVNSFTSNYITSLSPSFLFVSGDPNPRQTVPGFGLISFFLLPFLIIGILSSKFNLFTFWLLISPIPSALTTDGATHATRLFLILPALFYFIAKGIFTLKPKFLTTILLLLFSFHFFSFLHEYFVHYPKEYFLQWNYGYDQLYSIPTSNHRVFVDDSNFNATLPFLFYQHISPLLVHTAVFSDQTFPNIFNKFDGFRLSQSVFFINDWHSSQPLDEISSFAQSGDIFFLLQLKDIPGDWDLSLHPIPGFSTLKTVYFPNHTIFGQVIQKQ
ncbi:hypothetical protein M1116_00780, partial [Patescibacteria group bacterium]|nr:hypothetical protein [Patescibacteria group bacterium]